MTIPPEADTDDPDGRQPGPAGAGKRPGAYRTISEVAEDLAVPQHVLRFWEGRFAQLRPLKRAGGRRYYRPDDIDLIRGIRHLLHAQGYTIRGAQQVLRQGGVRFVQAVGRGEAQAEAPRPEADDDRTSAAAGNGPDAHDTGDDGTGEAGTEEHDARANLRAALDELRACRAALADLRAGLAGVPSVPETVILEDRDRPGGDDPAG